MYNSSYQVFYGGVEGRSRRRDLLALTLPLTIHDWNNRSYTIIIITTIYPNLNHY